MLAPARLLLCLASTAAAARPPRVDESGAQVFAATAVGKGTDSRLWTCSVWPQARDAFKKKEAAVREEPPTPTPTPTPTPAPAPALRAAAIPPGPRGCL